MQKKPSSSVYSNTNKTDVLGVYPESVHTQALPERRFLKTSRMLTITAIFFNAFSLMLAGFIIYGVHHTDLMVASSKRSFFITQDHVEKKLKTIEYNTKVVSSVQLLVESLIKRYLKERFTLPWDNNKSQKLWGQSGFVQTYSSQNVKNTFVIESNQNFQKSRNENFIQDVFIYSLEYVKGNLWKATVEVVDLPIPDPLNPLCQMCATESLECIKCKTENALNRHLYTIYLRSQFGQVTLDNPAGIYISDFYKIYRPTNPKSPKWDLPVTLQKIQNMI